MKCQNQGNSKNIKKIFGGIGIGPMFGKYPFQYFSCYITNAVLFSQQTS